METPVWLEKVLILGAKPGSGPAQVGINIYGLKKKLHSVHNNWSSVMIAKYYTLESRFHLLLVKLTLIPASSSQLGYEGTNSSSKF